MSEIIVNKLLITLDDLEGRLQEVNAKQSIFKNKMKEFSPMENSTIFAALANEVRTINQTITLVEDIYKELKVA